MESINKYLLESLKKRTENDSIRLLPPPNNCVDFCSNDYLGFTRSTQLKEMFQLELEKYPKFKLGSTGSRLLAGNDQFTENLETEIATFHNSPSSLLFNSGYDANIGIFSCLLKRGDTIICDEYIHASIIDGVRLSHASRFIFKHNDINNLRQKLMHAKGRIFIVVESIYSMDGDEAPLKEICDIADEYNAAVIVDEAHAIGIFGTQGRGITEEKELVSRVFARIVTFGKALGAHGAAILGSSDLRSYLINYSRSFIYTTAAPFLNHLAIKVSYKFLQNINHQFNLHQRINFFRSEMKDNPYIIPSRSGIQVLVIRGNKRVKEIASKLQSMGYDVRPILSPSVPEGSERLRICLHNHNSITEIKNLCKILNSIL